LAFNYNTLSAEYIHHVKPGVVNFFKHVIQLITECPCQLTPQLFQLLHMHRSEIKQLKTTFSAICMKAEPVCF